MLNGLRKKRQELFLIVERFEKEEVDVGGLSLAFQLAKLSHRRRKHLHVSLVAARRRAPLLTVRHLPVKVIGCHLDINGSISSQGLAKKFIMKSCQPIP